MKQIHYIVYFEVRDKYGFVDKASAHLPTSWSVERLNQGFWLNEDFKITDKDDHVYWVAPARVIGVEKKVELVNDVNGGVAQLGEQLPCKQ